MILFHKRYMDFVEITIIVSPVAFFDVQWNRFTFKIIFYNVFSISICPNNIFATSVIGHVLGNNAFTLINMPHVIVTKHGKCFFIFIPIFIYFHGFDCLPEHYKFSSVAFFDESALSFNLINSNIFSGFFTKYKLVEPWIRFASCITYGTADKITWSVSRNYSFVELFKDVVRYHCVDAVLHGISLLYDANLWLLWQNNLEDF